MKPYRAGLSGPSFPLLVDEAGRCHEVRGGSGVELEFAQAAATDITGAGTDSTLCVAPVPKVYVWDGIMRVKLELIVPAVRATGGGGTLTFRFYLGKEGAGQVWNQESQNIGDFPVAFNANGNTYVTCVTFTIPPAGRYYFWAGYVKGTTTNILGATCSPAMFRASMA